MAVREAMLYTTEDTRVQCAICAHQCSIAENSYGVCRTRQNRDGKLYTLIYSSVSSAHADPIEKKPLYHFFPGSFVFSLGTISCNFRCKHCQNWSISTARVGEFHMIELSPEEAVRRARALRCDGIAWTYNEPTIWFEYTYDSAKLAKQAGLYTVYVTNGYISEVALNELAPFLDAANVDVKSFSDSFYQNVSGARLQPVLETCERMQEKQIHLELTYLIIPGYNDDAEEIKKFADWVVGLNNSIPVHFSRFYPMHRMLDVPPTSLETLEKVHDIAKEAGVEYVYLGNVPGHEYEHTFCPDCGTVLIERTGYQVRTRISKPACPACGRRIQIRL
ncbi:MAG: AmmeMemoRadiSam system radical SAM enzyme [Methanophagales archaeon ANME-1-THS]|nr:MAG: AmmeMemoRadiSam system radical SAM enzyme [Methanophagales archaeon ANME-1-THS]